MNQVLRKQLTDEVSLPFHIAIGNLRNWINRSALSDDVTLWRGMRVDPSWKLGDVVEDKGFISTSTDPGVARGFLDKRNESGIARVDGVMIKIQAPKGTKGGSIGKSKGDGHPDSNGPGENAELEVILLPGTKFQVIADQFVPVPTGGTVRQITVKVVSQ